MTRITRKAILPRIGLVATLLVVGYLIVTGQTASGSMVIALVVLVWVTQSYCEVEITDFVVSIRYPFSLLYKSVSYGHPQLRKVDLLAVGSTPMVFYVDVDGEIIRRKHHTSFSYFELEKLQLELSEAGYNSKIVYWLKR